jgi:hypothetical protein
MNFVIRSLLKNFVDFLHNLTLKRFDRRMVVRRGLLDRMYSVVFVHSELTRLVVEERQLFVGNFITKRGKLLRKLQICCKYLSAVQFSWT